MPGPKYAIDWEAASLRAVFIALAVAHDNLRFQRAITGRMGRIGGAKPELERVEPAPDLARALKTRGERVKSIGIVMELRVSIQIRPGRVWARKQSTLEDQERPNLRKIQGFWPEKIDYFPGRGNRR